MASKFSLSRPAGSVFPTALSGASGATYSVDADFHNVLRILRMLRDDRIPERLKPGLLCAWFFPEAQPDAAEGIAMFADFLGGKSDGKDEQDVPVFDYEADAEEIYVSFAQLYGIDLFTERMHWRKFQALLSGAVTGETPLSRKLRLRTLDISGLPPEQRAEAQRAQDAVSLALPPVEVTEEIERRLKAGLPLGDILREVR